MTDVGVRLVRRGSEGAWEARGEWSAERSLAVVACNSQQVVCAAGPHLYYIEIGDGELIEEK